jgi:hypothetical protein
MTPTLVDPWSGMLPPGDGASTFVWTTARCRRRAWELGPTSGSHKLESGCRIVGRRRAGPARRRTSSARSRIDGCMAGEPGAGWAGVHRVAARHKGKKGKGRGQWPAYHPRRTLPSMLAALTAGWQSPPKTGRARRSLGGDALWRHLARGDAAKGHG